MSEGTPLDPVAVARIGVLVRTRLIGLHQLIAWADAWVTALEAPPTWLTELCTVRTEDAARGLLSDASAFPSDPAGHDAWNAEFLACLLLRHRNGALSWADFLDASGRYLDAAGGSRGCEEFFMQLNLLERMGYPEDLARAQREDIERSLVGALERMESAHRRFEAEARGD
ncbi:hypothetical protein [Corallococcus carmarthensis]|uniref:Uncharacterized protein n=1 Tax=Corallococcus carmarthensis TaxID=2316728 RepID=A0A3A8JH14_9BACT|nr:hypothetical protein [Corallococcus carmarthensis]NOK23219.1 hypothetical protein [Corallococcus carmarthensis]RKG94286.1 hypothetical protein D7X32_42645 [Corallococcus carmarthensis]